MKRNLFLIDCESQEVKSISECLDNTSSKFETKVCIANWPYNNGIRNFWRYVLYFIFPLSVMLGRGRYGTVIAWQQFYAIGLSFWSRLFHVKKCDMLVAMNFTYKRKKGILGKIYHGFMKYGCRNVDYFHVPSHEYVGVCCNELGIGREHFIVTSFGIPDTYSDMKDLEVDFKGEYVLSIGRSNRDFDFLVKVWEQDCLKDKQLVIISDVWQPSCDLPANIIHRGDIGYKDSFAWIKNCTVSIVPIADGKICSGDTTLLTAMMFGHPVVVTTPSTLAEMYVKDNINGICVPKDIHAATSEIACLLNDEARLKKLGRNAREIFASNYTRANMARSLCTQIGLI